MNRGKMIIDDVKLESELNQLKANHKNRKRT